MWPFIPLAIKKHQSQDDQRLKQSTFQEILSLFTVVKTCKQNLQLSVWWNVCPSNRPQKIISQRVGLQRWINGTWKKRREASILLTGRTAECCTLHSWGYGTNQRITGICCAVSWKSWICALIQIPLLPALPSLSHPMGYKTYVQPQFNPWTIFFQ